MEIFPGIHQFKIPIPHGSLGWTNVYFIPSPAGNLLIDSGWNTTEALQTLQAQIDETGAAWKDLHTLVLTHSHPDHSGLLDRLAQFCQPTLVLHEKELSLLKKMSANRDAVFEGMSAWMHSHGQPALRLPRSFGPPNYTPGNLPEQTVTNGSRIEFGDFDFEIILTPGHSPGHICLYEHQRRLLFAGDHVLLTTTPNVSAFDPASNPLEDYLTALHEVAKLPVQLVLPSHGPAFTQLKERAAVIERHHLKRAQTILATLDARPQTAYQVSSKIPWSTNGVPWEELPIFLQQMAVGETVAHLVFLESEGRVSHEVEEGVLHFARVE